MEEQNRLRERSPLDLMDHEYSNTGFPYWADTASRFDVLCDLDIINHIYIRWKYRHVISKLKKLSTVIVKTQNPWCVLKKKEPRFYFIGIKKGFAIRWCFGGITHYYEEFKGSILNDKDYQEIVKTVEGHLYPNLYADLQKLDNVIIDNYEVFSDNPDIPFHIIPYYEGLAICWIGHNDKHKTWKFEYSSKDPNFEKKAFERIRDDIESIKNGTYSKEEKKTELVTSDHYTWLGQKL